MNLLHLCKAAFVLEYRQGCLGAAAWKASMEVGVTESQFLRCFKIPL